MSARPMWQMRLAGPDDLDVIMAIETPTFTTDAWSSSAMLSDLESQHTVYLIAFDQNLPEDIVGYAGLLAPIGSGEADIQTIAVAETARGNGLGRLMMQTLIGEARARRAENVFLEVRADNPIAEGLYESLGFERIAVRPHYYQPDNVDARIMRLALEVPSAVGPIGSDVVDAAGQESAS